MSNKKLEVYNELRRKADLTNKRLARLENFGQGKWASTIIQNHLASKKVNSLTPSGRVSVSKNKTIGQMRATINAMDNFLNSKTSTIKGIKETRQNMIEGMRRSLSTENADLSFGDAEALYRIFDDREYSHLLDIVEPSDLFAFIQEAVEKKMSKDKFIETVSNYVTSGFDDDIRDKLMKVYNEYVVIGR